MLVKSGCRKRQRYEYKVDRAKEKSSVLTGKHLVKDSETVRLAPGGREVHNKETLMCIRDFFRLQLAASLKHPIALYPLKHCK